MPARRWFYELLTQEFGPVSSEQIDDLVSDGTLATSDRVRPEDSETWITVAQMPESTQDGSTAPAELSDLSELSFSFEENSESGTAADQLNIDTFSIEGDSDSAYAESDAAKRRRDKLTATDDEEDEEATELYFVESMGQVLGPIPLLRLMQMADRGALTAEDKVRPADSDEWQPADSMPEFAAAFMNLISDSEDPVPKRTAPPAANAEAKLEASPAEGRTSKPKKKVTSKQAAAERPVKKKKKRKKKKKEDVLLKEIFSEVFTEDGEVKPEHQPGAAPAAQAQTPAAPGAPPVVPGQSVAATPEAQPAVNPGVPAPAPMGMAAPTAAAAGGFGQAHSGFGATSAAASAPTLPTRPPKRKKSRGAGFTMPDIDGKFLGIVGGVVLLLGVVAGGVMGYIPLPGFSIDEKEAVTSLYEEYKKMSAGTITEAQWGEFSGRARSIVKTVNQQLSSKGAEMSPDEVKMRIVSQRLGMLAATPFSSEESRDKAWAATQKAMGDAPKKPE